MEVRADRDASPPSHPRTRATRSGSSRRVRAFVCISLWVSPQLMFEAVPRVELTGAAIARAGTIIGSVYDDESELGTFLGDWGDRVSDADRDAFRQAWVQAAAK